MPHPPLSPSALTDALKSRAGELGFVLSGACPAVTPHGITRLTRWLEAGYAGKMTYLADRFDAYRHPRHILNGTRSLLVLAMSYHTRPPSPIGAGEGRVSRYAWGRADYHDVIHGKLAQLAQHVGELAPAVRARGVVDTAPLLEREFAQLAGLGWIGKNTMLLHRHHGSWLFLAALLLDCELEYDEPFAIDHCGTCTACLDACPTGAFPEPHVLDATRCISYLTIELRESIPHDLRGPMGDWLFGCDVCQDVCPWNRRATASDDTFAPQASLNPARLPQLFALGDAEFRALFRHTTLWRARRRGLLRNAAIVLGNHASPESAAALALGLRDQEALVRATAAWSLGQIATTTALAALRARLAIENDDSVRCEIIRALE